MARNITVSPPRKGPDKAANKGPVDPTKPPPPPPVGGKSSNKMD